VRSKKSRNGQGRKDEGKRETQPVEKNGKETHLGGEGTLARRHWPSQKRKKNRDKKWGIRKGGKGEKNYRKTTLSKDTSLPSDLERLGLTRGSEARRRKSIHRRKRGGVSLRKKGQLLKGGEEVKSCQMRWSGGHLQGGGGLARRKGVNP